MRMGNFAHPYIFNIIQLERKKIDVYIIIQMLKG